MSLLRLGPGARPSAPPQPPPIALGGGSAHPRGAVLAQLTIAFRAAENFALRPRRRRTAAAASAAQDPPSLPPPPPPPQLAEPLFSSMCDALAAWKAQYFTTIVPRSAHDGAELAEWVAAVRRLHRRGSLPAAAVARLDVLGMLWDVDVVTAKWHANFHVAREFKEAHGGAACDLNAALPADYTHPSGSGSGGRADWVEAARWVARQRELYAGQKLTDLRLRLLKDVLGELLLLLFLVGKLQRGVWVVLRRRRHLFSQGACRRGRGSPMRYAL